MNITEKEISVNVNDGYYFSDANVCALVECIGFSGEEVKAQILSNQEKAQKYDLIEKFKIDPHYIGEVITHGFIEHIIKENKLLKEETKWDSEQEGWNRND